MPSNEGPNPAGTLKDSSGWTVTRRVIGALLLRELLTRYGRNNIGFLWLIVEPMLFTLVVTLIWRTIRANSFINIPIVAFALTGYASLIMWRGMSGRCIGAVRANLSLMFHRQVTVLDVYAARIILEFIGASASLVILTIIFYSVGWLQLPEDAMMVLGGWLLLAWFGLGLGLTIGGLSEKYEIVGKLWPPMSYILYPLSGVAFMADALPQKMREVVLWLPMLNALEYVREGWFGSMVRTHYDIPYVMVFNLLLLFAGLSMARQVGGRMDEE